MKSSVDIRLFGKLIKFFKDVKNYVYENIPVPKECPQPVIIAEEENNNNTDNSIDKTVETIFEGGRFFSQMWQNQLRVQVPLIHKKIC